MNPVNPAALKTSLPALAIVERYVPFRLLISQPPLTLLLNVFSTTGSLLLVLRPGQRLMGLVRTSLQKPERQHNTRVQIRTWRDREETWSFESSARNLTSSCSFSSLIRSISECSLSISSLESLLTSWCICNDFSSSRKASRLECASDQGE